MMAPGESFCETYPAVPESVPVARAALTWIASEPALVSEPALL